MLLWVTYFIQQFGGQEFTADELTVDKVKELMTPRDWEQLSSMTRDHNLYQNLVQSMFPTIHGSYSNYELYGFIVHLGNDECKRGILLMLFGGVAKVTTEGTTLRGDINVCIVGDPSTAKSQLLKLVRHLVTIVIHNSLQAGGTI